MHMNARDQKLNGIDVWVIFFFYKYGWKYYDYLKILRQYASHGIC